MYPLPRILSHCNVGLCLRRCVLSLLLLLVLATRYVPGIGEWYAVHLYPTISLVLSAIASIVPFSFEEWIVIMGILFLLVYPVVAAIRREGALRILMAEVEAVLWLVAWFYVGWGCNYNRASFYERVEVMPVATDSLFFSEFLYDYADSINALYADPYSLTHAEAEFLIKSQYDVLPSSFGLTRPCSFQHPKVVAFNRLYSAVGVLGYMGPFMGESQLNLQLLPEQYPFTYAHELAHLLGISSEAEANYWAYLVCTTSANPLLRYSGYYCILPYLSNNASALLSSDDYWAWRERLDPRIIESLIRKQEFWQAQRIGWIDELQESFYDWYLRSNQIPSGRANYSQVIQMILSVRTQQWMMESQGATQSTQK